MAQLLVKAGADVKAATRVGSMTPLFMAAKNGSAAMIQLLITAGADVNRASTSTGTTPLMLAAAAGKAHAVKVLVEKGADANAKDLTNGQTALMFAASLNRDEAIRVLTGRGADTKATSKVSPVAEEARNRDNGAGRRGRAPVVMGGNTALLFAARDGQLSAVRALVEGGADVNQTSVSDNMPPSPPAIINGHFDVAKYLLDHGADPNVTEHGQQTGAALCHDRSQYAQREWYPPPSVEQEKTTHLELIRALLDKGADVNARSGARPWYRGFGNSGGPDPNGSTAILARSGLLIWRR